MYPNIEANKSNWLIECIDSERRGGKKINGLEKTGIENSNNSVQRNFYNELAKNFPEDKGRPVNKILRKSDYFYLLYNTRNEKLSIEPRNDLIYAVIPYDLGRHYIQRAAIQYLINPRSVMQYLRSHEFNLRVYLKLSIYETTRKKVDSNSKLVTDALNFLYEQPLFAIQVCGRLMQHDETGPITTNLAGKFYPSKMQINGISGYVVMYLKFILESRQTLALITDGEDVSLGLGNKKQRQNADLKKIELSKDINQVTVSRNMGELMLLNSC